VFFLFLVGNLSALSFCYFFVKKKVDTDICYEKAQESFDKKQDCIRILDFFVLMRYITFKPLK